MNIDYAARKLLKENIGLKKGEKIAVVSDREKCKVFDAVCKAVPEFGAELFILKLSNKRENSSPIPEAAELFKKVDAIVAITNKSISHSPETRIARIKYNKRVISMVEVDEKLFLKASEASIEEIRKINNKLMDLFKDSKEIKILTESGTDLIFLRGKEIFTPDDGDSTVGRRLNNFPSGEVCVMPIDIANGTLTVDFSRVGIKPSDKAQLILKDGKIVDWNKKGKILVDYLKKAGGEKALLVVELGIGTNPHCKELMGIIIHDEKIFGSCHIAFGGCGDKRPCNIHEDVILLKPTIYADDKMIMEKGVLK